MTGHWRKLTHPWGHQEELQTPASLLYCREQLKADAVRFALRHIIGERDREMDTLISRLISRKVEWLVLILLTIVL